MRRPRLPGLRALVFSPAFWLAGGLLAVHVILGGLATKGQSLTYDERAHFRYGRQILDGNSDRFDDSKMPSTSLNAAVLMIAERLWPETVEDLWQPERLGRIATLLFSAVVGLILFLWAREWYGDAAGVGAVFLYALEPNILAHAGLTTTDIYAAGMVAVCLYTFWRFLERPGPAGALVSMLSLGLAQLAKYTCASLFLLLPALAVAHGLARRRSASPPAPFRRRLVSSLAVCLLFVLASTLIINAGFLFNRSLTPLEDYAFRSDLFNRVLQALPWLRGLPVPLPYPYLEGFDLVLYRDQTGEGFGQVYLLGQTRQVGGFPGYFLVASLFKMPLAEQLLILVSLVLFLVRRRAQGFWRREVFLLGPALLYACYFNFVLQAQIGLRLYLVVFPLLIVFASRLLRDWTTLGARWRLLLAAAGLWLAASVGSYYPHFIPYFNELVWNRLHASRILSDSNLDYGQAKGYLAVYLAQHPQAVFEPLEPEPSTVVISIDRLTGVRDSPPWYQRLSQRLEPIDHIAYAYLVYEIGAQDLDLLGP